MRFPSILVLSVCVLVCLGSLVAAQEKEDAATVRSLEQKWADSYKHRDVGLLSSLLADNFVITVEDGSTYGKLGYISHSAAASTRVDVAEFTELKVRVHGDLAVVTGAYHERGQDNGKPYEYHDRFTDVWTKSGGKWQVIASHYSVPKK